MQTSAYFITHGKKLSINSMTRHIFVFILGVFVGALLFSTFVSNKVGIAQISSLPSPWQSQDIGAVGTTGSASFSDSNVFTIKGSGYDIWNKTDEFHFVYKQLSGDAVVIVKVDSLTNTNSYAKAGVMIRESLSAGSRNAFLAVTPSKGIKLQYRTSTNSDTGSAGSSGKAPYWLKLERVGDKFTAYKSIDGVKWSKIKDRSFVMNSQVYIGLAVTSHSDRVLTTGVFSNVFVNGKQVQTPTPTATPTPTPTPTVPPESVTLDNINGTANMSLSLRSCPDTNCTIIETIPQGVTIPLLQASIDWFMTQYSQKSGWVLSGAMVDGQMRRYVAPQGTISTDIRRGNTSRKMVSYTFDAGADVGFAAQILDFLKTNNIKASFGLTGHWVDENPTVAKRITAEGHHLINHTYNHFSFTGFSPKTPPLTPAKRLVEIELTEQSFKNVLGTVSSKPYWRPPYGDLNESVLRDVGADRFSKTIMWTVGSEGWKGISAQEICDSVVNGAVNGAIILFHVGAGSQDANALECITTRLRTQGYSFGTVPQVIAP